MKDDDVKVRNSVEYEDVYPKGGRDEYDLVDLDYMDDEQQNMLICLPKNKNIKSIMIR